MLTLKLISEETDRVIAGLEKKHFKNAKETIAQVLELNDKRRSTQNVLDKNLAEVNSISKSIGFLMKEGKKEEAEEAKKKVAEIKEACKNLQAEVPRSMPMYNIQPPPVLAVFWVQYTILRARFPCQKCCID